MEDGALALVFDQAPLTGAVPVIDSQVHTYEGNTPGRPWHDVPDWPPHVTGDEMVAAMDAVGVDGAIIVSPFTMYRYDASYAVQVQRAHPGRFGLVKPLDPKDAAAAEVVADWKRTPGAVGVRIFVSPDFDPKDPGVTRIARAAASCGLPINLQCWGTLQAAMDLIDRHPQTRFVIDHLGVVQPFHRPVPLTAWAELPTVLALAWRTNAVIKVSGACTLSREPFPFLDIWDPLARIFDAWGFERCLWGSDWTRALALLSYPEAVEAFRVTHRLSESERAMLMGGACARTYGWAPARQQRPCFFCRQ